MQSKDRQIIIFIALLIYRIPLSHLVGDNGCGFLAGPLEMFICQMLIFGTGLGLSFRGMLKERCNREQYKNADVVYGIAKKYTIIASVLLLLINAGGYEFISGVLLGDAGQRLAYIFVGPALVLGMFIDLNVGFLSGTGNGQAVMIGQATEAVSLGVFMILGAVMGNRYGVKVAALLINEDVSAMYGAMGAMIGLCLGELIALIELSVMSLIYMRTFRHLIRTDSSRKTEYASDISGKLILNMLTDGLLAGIIQLPVLIMLTIYRRSAIKAGTEDAAAMVGAFYSKYLSIAGILSALAVWNIPSGIKGIQAAVISRDERTAGERLSRLFGRTMYFAIPAAVFCCMLSEPIVKTLFTGKTTTAVSVLTIGCAIIVIYPVMYLADAVLLQTGYHKELIFVSAISFIITLVPAFIFVSKPDAAFKYIVLLLMLGYFLDAALGFVMLFRNYHMSLRIVQTFLIPLVISGVIGVLLKLLSGALMNSLGGVLTLIICIIPAWFLYNLACMFLRVCSAGAMEHKFLGSILVRIGQNLGIY